MGTAGQIKLVHAEDFMNHKHFEVEFGYVILSPIMLLRKLATVQICIMCAPISMCMMKMDCTAHPLVQAAPELHLGRERVGEERRRCSACKCAWAWTRARRGARRPPRASSATAPPARSPASPSGNTVSSLPTLCCWCTMCSSTVRSASTLVIIPEAVMHPGAAGSSP